MVKCTSHCSFLVHIIVDKSNTHKTEKKIKIKWIKWIKYLETSIDLAAVLITACIIFIIYKCKLGKGWVPIVLERDLSHTHFKEWPAHYLQNILFDTQNVNWIIMFKSNLPASNVMCSNLAGVGVVLLHDRKLVFNLVNLFWISWSRGIGRKWRINLSENPVDMVVGWWLLVTDWWLLVIIYLEVINFQFYTFFPIFSHYHLFCYPFTESA